MATYTYVSVDKVSPSTGTTFGGTAVTITGFGFDLATGVTFDGATATAIVYVSNTTITCVTPLHDSGAVTVAVVGVGEIAAGYTYVVPVNLLPPYPYYAPTTQDGSSPGGLTSTPWANWWNIVKARIESLPGSVAAENVIGVLGPANIPQLPSSRITMNAPRLLGRSTAGSGTSEEIQVGPMFVLSGGVLSLKGIPGALTQGSVIFAGSGGIFSEDNAQFFWDDTNHRLGLGTATPAYALDVHGSMVATGPFAGVIGSSSSYLFVFNSTAGGTVFQAKGDASVIISGLNSDPTVTGLSINMAAGGAWTPMVVTSSGGSTGDVFVINAAKNVGIGKLPPDANHRLCVGAADGTNEGIAIYCSGAALEFKDFGNTVNYGVVQSFTTGAGGIVMSTNGNANPLLLNSNAGPVGVGGVTSPTSRLHLPAGTATANFSPLKFTSGTLLGTPEAGAIEFVTDGFFATITTGAARKGVLLNDGTALTSGRVPFATTNGRLTDDSDMTFAVDTLTITKVSTPSIISTAAVTVTPAAGSNLNVALSTTGDFAVNTNQLYVDTSAAKVGINNAAPSQALSVTGEADFYAGATLRGIVGPSSWATNFFSFQNATLAESASNFALSQDDVGNTYINAVTGKSLFLRVNNATQMSFTNSVINMLFKLSQYNAITTAGWGVPAIYGSGRSTAQAAAVASVATYTVGAADGSFEVLANVLVTTATSHAFTVQVAYTDEGSTARTLTLSFTLVSGGTLVTSVANANGAVPYMGVPQRIRCKTATTITISTTGTFTTVVYNVEGSIIQVS